MSAPLKSRHLGDLAQLRAALVAERRAEEMASAAEHARRLAERRERELFATTVGAVVPLRKPAAPPLARPRPPAVARQRERDEAAALAESIGEGFDAESLLETDDALSFRRRGIGPDVVRKLRRGVWVAAGRNRSARPAQRRGARPRRRTSCTMPRAPACAACASSTARASARPAASRC